jgi:hypothetical protein
MTQPQGARHTFVSRHAEMTALVRSFLESRTFESVLRNAKSRQGQQRRQNEKHHAKYRDKERLVRDVLCCKVARMCGHRSSQRQNAMNAAFVQPVKMSGVACMGKQDGTLRDFDCPIITGLEWGQICACSSPNAPTNQYLVF